MYEQSTGLLHPLAVAAESSLTNHIIIYPFLVLSQVPFWSVLCINWHKQAFYFLGSSDKIKLQTTVLTDGLFSHRLTMQHDSGRSFPQMNS